jgi:hypothetical protein
MLSVEVDGAIVRRPAVPQVLQFDPAGPSTVVRLQPQLLAGEILVERAGRIAAIVRETHA